MKIKKNLITTTLIAGASLLLFACISADGNTTKANSASAFNDLTELMSKDHAHQFSTGTDGAYTIWHNGKRITVTMTHAYINRKRVSYQKALRALRSKRHHAKRYHYRKIRNRRNHKHYHHSKRSHKHHHYKK